jgi:hypothetical protein
VAIQTAAQDGVEEPAALQEVEAGTAELTA